MKTFRVQWSPQAIEDLRLIYDYIYDRSPKGADTVFDTLLDLGDSLDTMPDRFPVDPNVSTQTRIFRFIPKWSYKIFYQVNHESSLVIIARIFGTDQEPGKVEL